MKMCRSSALPGQGVFSNVNISGRETLPKVRDGPARRPVILVIARMSGLAPPAIAAILHIEHQLVRNEWYQARSAVEAADPYLLVVPEFGTYCTLVPNAHSAADPLSVH